jgi:hypothetical protein
MDIYVLVEDGKVLGAGSDRATAMDIADHRDQNAWTTWHPFTDSWERKHRQPAEDRRPVRQQIVRVPLAGVSVLPVEPSRPGGVSLACVLNRSEIEEIGRSFGAP